MSAMTMKELKSGICRWPIGDPRDGDFHFCSESSEPGISYCQHHTELAHNTGAGNRTKKKSA